MIRRMVSIGLLLSACVCGASATTFPHYTGEVLPRPQEVLSEWRLIELAEPAFNIQSEPNPSGAITLAADLLAERLGALAGEAEQDPAAGMPITILLGTFDQAVIESADAKHGLGLGTLVLPTNGYAIRVCETDDGVAVVAAGQGDRGAFYAAATLIQMMGIEQGKCVLKCADLNDWPHWQRVYVMDYSTAPPEHLKALALYKINGYAIQHRYEWRKFAAEESQGRQTYDQGLSAMAAFREQTGLFDYMLLLQIYARSGKEYPIIDITKDEDVADLAGRCRYAASKGITHVMILVDDWTPSRENRYVCPHDSEKERFNDSVGRAHGYLMRRLYEMLKPEHPGLELSICVAPYSLQHVYRNREDSTANPEMIRYLRDLDAEMPRDIPVVWTGPVICSAAVEREHFIEYSGYLGNRPTFLWDNSNGVTDVPNLPRFSTTRYAGFAADSHGLFYLNAFALWWPWQRPFCLNAVDALWNPGAFNAEASYKQAVEKSYGVGTYALVEAYRSQRRRVNVAALLDDPARLASVLEAAEDALKPMEEAGLSTKRLRADLDKQKGYLEQTLPEAVVPRFNTPPKLDGKLDDACWATQKRLTDFAPYGQVSDLEPTEVMLGYDKANLYVAFTGHHAAPIPEPVVKGRRDGHIYLDSDAFGMMLQPPDAGYGHLIVDCAGNIFDEQNSSGLAWDPDWSFAIHKESNSWAAEIRIPFASLQALPLDEFPERGTTWRANFIRYYDAAGQYSTWSDTHGNRFHVPRFFGVLKFK